MKKILSCILVASAMTSAMADVFFRNPRPALLEVRYMRKEVTDTMRRDSAYIKDEMMLRIGNDMTLFCGVKRFNSDSLAMVNYNAYSELLMSEMQKGNPNVFSSLSGNKSSYLYKYYKDNRIVEEDYFDITPWRCTEEWEKPEWEIIDESKQIMGYQCFKAITDYRGRKWIAWFAPDIPVQEGPWKLCGLPGLILEASDSAGDYSFVGCGLIQTGLGNVGYCQTRRNDDYVNVDRMKFLSKWRKYKLSNFAAKMRAAFGVGSAATTAEESVLNYDREETDYH